MNGTQGSAEAQFEGLGLREDMVWAGGVTTEERGAGKGQVHQREKAAKKGSLTPVSMEAMQGRSPQCTTRGTWERRGQEGLPSHGFNPGRELGCSSGVGA
jgi:hypothetical protein